MYPLDTATVVVGAAELDRLKVLAGQAPRKRVRLCTHAGPQEALQEMFIVLDRESYIRPHKHLAKVESFLVLEGDVTVVFFDDAGRVSEVIRMGPVGSGRPFYYRMAAAVFHTQVIHSPRLVFLEITQGPFRREQTEFAPWAPEEADLPGRRDYLVELSAAIGAHPPGGTQKA